MDVYLMDRKDVYLMDRKSRPMWDRADCPARRGVRAVTRWYGEPISWVEIILTPRPRLYARLRACPEFVRAWQQSSHETD